MHSSLLARLQCCTLGLERSELEKEARRRAREYPVGSGEVLPPIRAPPTFCWPSCL